MENTNQVRLENWHYMMEMGGIRGDAWRLCGEVYGHPNFDNGYHVLTSTPVKLEGRMLTTASGRLYELGVCDGREEIQVGHILNDIKRGSTLLK